MLGKLGMLQTQGLGGFVGLLLPLWVSCQSRACEALGLVQSLESRRLPAARLGVCGLHATPAYGLELDTTLQEEPLSSPTLGRSSDRHRVGFHV